jgi:zinc protease
MYSSLTKDDVLRVYYTYLKGKGAVVLSATPKGQDALIAGADNFKIDSTKYIAPDYGYNGLQYVKAKDNFDRKKIPATGANPVVKVPQFWKKELPNGIKVIGAQNSEVPTVTFSLSIPGGHLASANDLSKAGLSSFFTDMMMEDTKAHTAEQLTAALQSLGSTISIVSNTDEVT